MGVFCLILYVKTLIHYLFVKYYNCLCVVLLSFCLQNAPSCSKLKLMDILKSYVSVALVSWRVTLRASRQRGK